MEPVRQKTHSGAIPSPVSAQRSFPTSRAYCCRKRAPSENILHPRLFLTGSTPGLSLHDPRSSTRRRGCAALTKHSRHLPFERLDFAGENFDLLREGAQLVHWIDVFLALLHLDQGL